MKMALILFMSLMLLFGSVYSQSSSHPTKTDFENFINGTVDLLDTTADSFVRAGSTSVTAASSGIEKMFAAFSTGSCEPSPVAMEYVELTALAIIIVVFAIIILYLIGNLLQMPNMIAFAKSEVYHLFFIIIHIVVITAIVMGGNYFYGIITSNVPPTDPVYYGKTTYIDAAIAFTRLIVAEISKNYSAMVLFNTIIHIFYTATMYIGTNFRSMYNFNLGTALKPFIDLISIGLQALGLALGEWITHGIVLCFIKKWSWSIFFPISILLRAFPQTRQLGVALFMLVMALVIVYPLMFLIMYETHKLLNPYLVDSLSQIKNLAAKTGIVGLTGMALAIAMLGGGAIIPVVGGVIAIGTYDLLRNAVYYVVIMGAVLPFFSIFITLTAAKEWAKMLGVEVNYMSFLKII